MTTNEHPIDTLVDRINTIGVPACVGLDPDQQRLPDGLSFAGIKGIEVFCLGVIEAVADLVPAVKPQSACFERFGSAGCAVLERVCAKARSMGLVVVLDAKRGDIGVSARHYAAMATSLGAHFITVNPYLGMETIEPYLEMHLGVFALVRTSNPGSDALQNARLETGRTVSQLVASQLNTLGQAWRGTNGLSAVGAVVGATKGPQECAALREAMPSAPMLIPGIGAQGGTIEDIRPLCRCSDARAGQAGVLVNASRSVNYPRGGSGSDWRSHVRSAAMAFGEQTRALVH